MKKTMMTMMMATAATFGGSVEGIAQTTDGFQYTDERFADIQMLRYKVEGFDNLTLKKKTFMF